ncbi:MAG: hypothetical protein R2864_03985 [Syntrophotaleaceae bacterium]
MPNKSVDGLSTPGSFGFGVKIDRLPVEKQVMSIINPMLTIRPVSTAAQAATPTEGRHYDLRAGQLGECHRGRRGAQ